MTTTNQSGESEVLVNAAVDGADGEVSRRSVVTHWRAPADESVTVIEPRPGWRLIDVRELWRARELLFFLAWRDVKVRYKQTVLGAAWALLQPLAAMLVFTVFLRRVAADPHAVLPYPLFVFAGMLPWTFFANAISTAGISVVSDQSLVTKTYFPRLLLPMSTVATGLVDFTIGCALLAGMMAAYGVAPGWGILLVPALVGLLIVAALGVGTLLAALTVAFRDFRHVVPFMMQLWMFATPSIYFQGADAFGARAQTLMLLNPAHGIITNFRAAVLGGKLDLSGLASAAVVSLALLLIGCFYFRRVERTFADII